MLIAAPVDGAVYRKTTLPIIAAKSTALQIRHCGEQRRPASAAQCRSGGRSEARAHHCLPGAGFMQHPFNVQQGDVGLPQLMVARQRGIVSDHPLHLRLAICLKHTQQYCGERDKERGGSVKARCQGEVIGRKGFSWLYCRMQR